MNKLESAIGEICRIEKQAARNTWLNSLDPLSKLFVTIWYVAILVSFDKYYIMGVCSMFLYPMAVFTIGEVPFRQCIRRIWLVFPLLLVLGMINPFLDRSTAATVLGIQISGGMISMLTLFIKGVFTVLSVYLLIISTTIENVCDAFRRIHVPEVLVTTILLIYRYINVLLKETNRLMEAYAMRAPDDRGIRFRVWGTLTGNLLLRSIDRAHAVYESMNIRGYEAGNDLRREQTKTVHKGSGIIWAAVWGSIILLCRVFPIFSLIGRLFVS